MFEFNIYGQPLTVDEIEKLKDKARAKLSPAEKAILYCPVPGVDLVAGLAAAAMFNHPMDPYRDDWAGSRRDWSQSSVASAYAGKVAQMGRPLIRAEVEALERQVAAEAMGAAAGRAAMAFAIGAAEGAGKQAAGQAAKAAGDALDSLGGWLSAKK